MPEPKEKELNILQRFKALFAEIKADLAGDQKFGEAKLKDGTIIMYEGDTPMPNMKAVVITPEGQQVPAPDGEHTLEDGTIIVCKGGVIEAVTPASAPSADPNAPPAQDMNTGGTAASTPPSMPTKTIERQEIEKIFSEQFAAEKEAFATLLSELKEKHAAEIKTLSEKFAASESANAELKKESDATKQKFASIIEKLEKKIEEFETTPADDSAKKKGEGKPAPEKTIQEKVREFAAQNHKY